MEVRSYQHWKNFEIVYEKSCNPVRHFARKMVRDAVHNAFLKSSTLGTPSFQCVPAAFRQRERRSHAYPLEMTPEGGIVVMVVDLRLEIVS